MRGREGKEGLGSPGLGQRHAIETGFGRRCPLKSSEYSFEGDSWMDFQLFYHELMGLQQKDVLILRSLHHGEVDSFLCEILTKETTVTVNGQQFFLAITQQTWS